MTRFSRFLNGHRAFSAALILLMSGVGVAGAAVISSSAPPHDLSSSAWSSLPPEKRAIAQRYESDYQQGLSTPDNTNPQIDPLTDAPSDGPELGIVEDAPAFYTDEFTISTTRWQTWTDDSHSAVAMVYVAMSNQDPRQGYVIVQIQPNGDGPGKPEYYSVGNDTGQLSISNAKEGQLFVAAADGSSFTFNLAARTVS